VLADGTASMDRRAQGTGPESFDCPEVAPAPEFVSADWWCPFLRAPTMKPGWCDHVGAPVVTWHLPRADNPSVPDVAGRDVSRQPPVPEGEGLLGWRD